ncbi:hypothetical protein PMPD1_3860 [Paramixta manurensis]|uniref:Uncharacterized protein n=1 Tax=Paramixta manurensis TaxID=2740817 RepID=A0A6M8UIM4_9GAMM|nr:hypothetical protein PMPD1_3860 [Erwiniaceae bacterium PD-1]
MAGSSRLFQLLTNLVEEGELPETSEGYVLSLSETLSVEIEESPADHMTVSCLLNAPEERFYDWGTLAVLLQTNLLGLEHPPILVGALIEEQQILMWSRQPFILLDRPALKRLFERFATQAEKLEQWLAQPLVDEVG